VVQPDGEEIHFEHDLEGNVIKVKDALGNEVHMFYDANGNLIREVGKMGEERHYTYTSLGAVASIVDEAGRKVCYHYAPGGRLREVCYPEGVTERYDYDQNGNVKTFVDKRGYKLSYLYDNLDQIIRITEDGIQIYKEFTYDSMGHVISTRDQEGNKTVYEYTITGQLRRVTDALGHQTEYGYDSCDRLIEVRQYGEFNEKTLDYQVTKYERDINGQVIAAIDPLGQKETYQYSKRGELLQKIDKEGYLTKYSYTPQKDVKEIQYADGRKVKFSYNPLRQLQQIEDWLGVTKIENDAGGRATCVTYPDGKEVSYKYGSHGERKSITYPDGKTVYYGYDEHLRLSQLKEGDNVISYGYDQKGDLSYKKFPNGVETNYQHNYKGQITALVHKDPEGILDAYRYHYDHVGNKVSIEKQRRNLAEESGIYSYDYDAMGRLSQVKKDDILKSVYDYDSFGNRISKLEYGVAGGTQTISYCYNALNQLIHKVDKNTGEETYNYDRRGNLSQVIRNGQIQNEYLYGAINRLEEASNHKGEGARYLYNGLGHRIGKQTGGVKAGMLQLQTENRLDPIERLNQQNVVPTDRIDYVLDMTREYYNLLEMQEVGREQKKTQTFLWDNNVASVCTEVSGIQESNYYLQDELGSPIRLLNSSGVVNGVYGYDDFGQELYPNVEGNLQPFGYTGYQRDNVAGTYYAQAREYFPAT
jgi:YD repeat-containing protein